jgi:hypothetical protein
VTKGVKARASNERGAWYASPKGVSAAGRGNREGQPDRPNQVQERMPQPLFQGRYIEGNIKMSPCEHKVITSSNLRRGTPRAELAQTRYIGRGFVHRIGRKPKASRYATGGQGREGTRVGKFFGRCGNKKHLSSVLLSGQPSAIDAVLPPAAVPTAMVFHNLIRTPTCPSPKGR